MLSSLRLRHFRCFDKFSCSLPAGTSIFIGDNAQGKTSVLEAVCVLLRLQSPRSQKPAEWVKFGEAGFGLAGTLAGRELRHFFENGKRRVEIDGVPMTKTADFLAQSGLVVWMGNSDLELVAGSSEPRRRYLDFLGSQLHPEYRVALRNYEQALRSRNAILKARLKNPRQIGGSGDLGQKSLEAYTAILAEHGGTLTRLRRKLCQEITPHAQLAHEKLSAQKETLALDYESGSGDDLLTTLAARREEEERRGITVAGPHRDDFSLTLNDRAAGVFASEGQQRTLALALKLGQATLLESVKGTAPILLLDDIFGELDPTRRNAVFAALPSQSQRLVTTTHLHWLQSHVKPDATFQIREGRLVT